jgi:hypothetical protein
MKKCQNVRGADKTMRADFGLLFLLQEKNITLYSIATGSKYSSFASDELVICSRKSYLFMKCMFIPVRWRY